jgi:hypothetical protein
MDTTKMAGALREMFALAVFSLGNHKKVKNSILSGVLFFINTFRFQLDLAGIFSFPGGGEGAPASSMSPNPIIFLY